MHFCRKFFIGTRIGGTSGVELQGSRVPRNQYLYDSAESNTNNSVRPIAAV